MTDIRYDIEAIMEVIEQVYNKYHELTISIYGCSSIHDGNLESVKEFNGFAQLYRWTAEQQAKLDEQRKEQNDQQAKNYRDSDPFLHLW